MPQSKLTLNRAVSSAKFLLNVAAGAASIATILGFAGSLWWVFELLEHPRPQYCLILVAAIIVGGISRQAWSFAWCLPLVLNLALIVPLFFTSAQGFQLAQAFSPEGDTLRMIHVTLDNENPDTTPAIQYIESQDVELILLLEVTPKSLSKLESALSRYRVVASEPRENSHGSAMLVPIKPSKPIEVVATQIVHLPEGSVRPMLEATIRWGGKEVAILSIQLTRPQSVGTSAFQKVEFDAVADWSIRQQKESKREVVAIGDFNSTPWSGRFREFLHQTNLRNSQRGFGLEPTWHAILPSPLMIAIDHCLHSKSITTINRATGPNIGSDHLPIFVELQRRV
ncbi:MAG: endonuclease/exonuclease/phosphatase family protein [Cyanobacteriota bacterium]